MSSAVDQLGNSEVDLLVNEGYRDRTVIRLAQTNFARGGETKTMTKREAEESQRT